MDLRHRILAVLESTKGQSEGVTADAIISAVTTSGMSRDDRMSFHRSHGEPEEGQSWFVYEQDEGMLFFSSEEEATKYATDQIPKYLDDGWSEEVEYIRVGQISAVSVQTNRQDRPDNLDDDGCDEHGMYWDPDWDFCCNYEIKPLVSS